MKFANAFFFNRPFPLIVISYLLLNACSVGPNYHRPAVIIPVSYKEATAPAPEGWKYAVPQDEFDKGNWWEVFQDSQLNCLEKYVDISNQNIALAIAQYDQARGLVSQARSAYFPTVSTSASVTRQQNSASGSSITSGTITSGAEAIGNAAPPPFTTYEVSLNASWAPDIWGGVRRNVESTVAFAKSTQAQLAATRLLTQATLAQYYFQLRGLDQDQKIYNDTVAKYQKLLTIARNKYQAGTASRGDVLQVQSQLELAQVQATDNGINRALYEHAIAVLIGQAPANFSLLPQNKLPITPEIPVTVPSLLLERRPDIAAAERLVAQANAQIGVAVAAYFPILTLTGSDGFNSTTLSHLFTKPANFWSLGAQLFETLFDGGLRDAQVKTAKAIYEQKIASYRQTVLTAFQNVEDNLATLRILSEETSQQTQAVHTAQQALEVVLNGYKAGTLAITDVLNAELTLFNAQKGLNDIIYRKMIAAVGLITALGGGWRLDQLQLPA